TTDDGPIVSTPPPQLRTVSWHAGRETASVFAVQRANIQHAIDQNEMNIPQQGHLAAQSIDFLGFQPVIGQEQEQSEDEPEQDQSQLDLNNLPDNSEIEGPQGLYNKMDGAKRIMATLSHASNLPVRRSRAADSVNFASGRHMLMQVWRQQQEEQLAETPPQKSQTPVGQFR
ncbi:MAG: hypothetical protein EZS28_041077, partial [Streblomastix strix]